LLALGLERALDILSADPVLNPPTHVGTSSPWVSSFPAVREFPIVALALQPGKLLQFYYSAADLNSEGQA
jgi:hypothetical protein